MRLLLCAAAVLTVSTLCAADQDASCESWTAAYTGPDATGQHVLGLWKFDSGAETADASEQGNDLKLEGAQIHADGRFGSCLECFAGFPVEDKRHRATTKRAPGLSPKGPFTLEMWLNPKPELDEKYPDAFLLDKKYVSHDDYQLVLGKADKYGTRVLRACLGFGQESSTWNSQPMLLKAGQWSHVAFTYDGRGTGTFFLNGIPFGSRFIEGRKSVSPGKAALSIGDRVGSLYHGFPGYIDEVRISNGALEFRRVKFQRISDRSCFVRMEPEARLQFAVTNTQRVPLEDARLNFSMVGGTTQELPVAQLGPGESTVVEYPLDCRLRADSYNVVAQLNVGGAVPLEARESFTVQIVARRPPDQFPVLMWGIYGTVSKEIERLKEIGFTHVLGVGASDKKIWEAGEPTDPEEPEPMAKTKAMLDEALANGITAVASLSPGARMRSHKEFLRVNRAGKKADPEKGDICGLFPELQKHCYNVGASVARGYSEFPAFGAAMIHTEVRGHARPCFHPHDMEAYRQATGAEIPPEMTGGYASVDYGKLPNFPESRVVPDHHPIYQYAMWYWKQGDGWNGLNTAVHQGLKSTGRKEFWTYHDPAVRVAKVYGSGGEVDVLSQWTYSYPDPIRIAVATDELLAMVGGAAQPQQVMKMTQIIWYRGQTAPIPKAGAPSPAYRARWEIEQPDAPFITIAPMHLREAFWTKIARPIKGIMYHGWQSLVPCDKIGGYRFTNPQTRWELARLIRKVVRPLGPTLLKVPGVKADVAYLQSFASEVFAKRGTMGWNGRWVGDGYQMLLWASLQPEIVFDETITQRGLDGYRVLVLFDCDVLTQGVVDRVKQFQSKGGIVVGDDHLCPAVQPDIVVASYNRQGRADMDKTALQARAAELRTALDARYQRYLDSSCPDVVPYLRRDQKTDYVFLVNDRREYGDYVGQHGIVMENGLPAQATVSIARPAGHVYDLVLHQSLIARAEGGRLQVPVDLGPGDGRMLMVTDRPVGGISLVVPEQVERGAKAACQITVHDDQGGTLGAIVPVELRIRDPEGHEAEFSGYYATADGQLKVDLDIAANDPHGIWTVEARELASGKVARQFIRVQGPQPWPPQKEVDKQLANPVQPKG